MSVLRRVKQQLMALGVNPKLTERFSRSVEQWVVRSGPEWTVERLKSLKVSLMEMLATGDHYKVPPGWATRLNRDKLPIFKDRLVHDMFSQARDNLMLAENFIRVYQSIVLRDTSEKQLKKMRKAVCSPSTAVEGFVEETSNSLRLRMVSKRVRTAALKDADEAKPLTQMVWSEKSSPELTYKGPTEFKFKSVKRRELDPLRICANMDRDVETRDLWKRYPNEVSKALIGMSNIPYLSFPMIHHSGLPTDVIPAGTIVAIQEGGAKARWIANPQLHLQAFGEPLKVKLQRIYRELYPEVRVDDQDSGREQVARWLSEGKTVYCYDCSSFTDRFPLKLQQKILSLLMEAGVISTFDYEAFMLVVSKEWIYPRTGERLKWSVGQPLGYGPSFALATLTHAALLDTLSPGGYGQWMVVGDDVVIVDPTLAEKYHSVMTDLGVEINLSKSVISPHIGEFLGKLITAKGVNPSVKATQITSEAQLMALANFFGEGFVEMLEEKDWRVKLISKLPRYLGGLKDSPEMLGFELSEINTNYLQQRSIESEIRDFHGEDQSDPQGVKLYMEWKSKLLQHYMYMYGDLTSTGQDTQYGENIRFNALGGFTTLNERTPEKALPTSSNTFMYILDSQWFMNSWTPLDVNLHLLNKWGYVYRNELPSTLSNNISYVYFSLNQESVTNDKSIQSSIRVFKNPSKSWRKIRQKAETKSGSASIEENFNEHKGNSFEVDI